MQSRVYLLVYLFHVARKSARKRFARLMIDYESLIWYDTNRPKRR